jgi:hypothetical protein
MGKIMRFSLHRFITAWGLTLCSILIASTGISQPKLLVVGGTAPDWGNVPNFTASKFRIVLKNSGTDTLILSEIGTSCGCTATLLSNDHIAPKDSANLDVTFDATRFAGQHVTKRISMVTNDATQSAVAINFKVNVLNILELSPTYFYIRTMKDSAKTGTLTITNVSDQKIQILGIQSNQDIFAPSISAQSLSPGDSAKLSVTVTPRSTGTFNGNIELTIDHYLAKQVNIRCFGFVTSPKNDKVK